MMLAILGLLAIAGSCHTDEPAPVPRYQVTDANLSEASTAAATLLHRQLVLSLTPGHPARKLRVSLSMPVSDPTDMLNALAAAYGLRWVEGPKPGAVSLLDKKDYQGTAAGLRQALADGLPADLREYVRPGNPNTTRSTEAILKELEEKDSPGLLAASAKGAVAIRDLDPSLSRPLLRYLNAFSAWKLGNTCDIFVKTLGNNSSAVFHYGPNPSGTKQFSFRVGNEWIAVGPE